MVVAVVEALGDAGATASPLRTRAMIHDRQLTSQVKNNYSAEMWSGSQEGSYLRLRDCRIT